MNKQRAKTTHRKCLAALTDTNVRNLMEHAANKTPILDRNWIDLHFVLRGAGCPAQLAGVRGSPKPLGYTTGDARARGDALGVMIDAVLTHYGPRDTTYYGALRALTDGELRRMWLAEGRRRGYEI